ncbi:hypothetical protein [Methylocystis sp. JR02]|nr:hypothetical protein [Methylocystis sp. JR02]MDJ0450225.1 hypothetical protein [Methylocystis sp. JR02]
MGDVRDLAKAHSAETIETLAGIMRDKEAPPDCGSDGAAGSGVWASGNKR